MAVSRVTRNYQVTVPRELRELADIKVGDTMLFVREGEDILLKKIDKDLLGRGFGLWKRAQEKTPWLVDKLRTEAERRFKGLKLQ
ncbi:AbrB/MazE/SpoVT family DNA-binding domain-containing protein [Candidatus Woesearchaeota archaeon]|nr:AbrB/MazE/SpoVT family DNA-binding domain-containing protein [Candidatus Woesearchaeota archaeon]